jgi:hypothetical protein
MSYPFRGFESSEWVRLGKMSGHVGQLLFVTLRVLVRGMVEGVPSFS